MTFFFSLLAQMNTTPFQPNELVNWVGWSILAVLFVYGVYHWREDPLRGWEPKKLILLGGLALAVPLTSLFLGLRLPVGGALPLPGFPAEPRGAALIVFSALPWILAAGLLGPLPASALGLFSGTLIALFETHSFFTPLELGGLALLFASAVRQRYRTPFYRALRRPLVAAIGIFLLDVPLYLIEAFLGTGGPIVSRLDYAITHFAPSMLAMGGELLVAGLVAEGVARAFPLAWGRNVSLIPSPVESSLQTRFFYRTWPLILLLLLTLGAGDWIVAGNASTQMLRDRLSSTAQIASDSVPFFLEAGQNLIIQLADDSRLASATPAQLSQLLSQDLRSVPFFEQIYYLDKQEHPVTGYPEANYEQISPTAEETAGIKLALNGVAVQSYTAPPANGGTTAQISFIAPVKDARGVSVGVLIARSDLASNPFTQPIIKAMQNMADIGGQGVIIDENQMILYSPIAGQVMTPYRGAMPENADFFDSTAPDGTRQLVFYQPVVGRPWAIALSVPFRKAQELSLYIAAPMLVLIALIALLAIGYLRFSLRTVTASLHTLAEEAGRISQGQLDHPLPVQGVDEVGQLRRAFEQMRVSLKARLEELNRLLLVSRGVASSLEMQDAVQPILEAALASGASMARVVLSGEPFAEVQAQVQTRFGLGPASELYSSLDEQILALSRQHDRLLLTNLPRGRSLNLAPGQPYPMAILAVPLRHENRYYGTLWVAYDNPRRLSEEETRFLSTLAGQAALAAANARLYATAEIGRQRMESILASVPDPILVTDQENRLLLSNPAATQIPGMAGTPMVGHPIQEIITQPNLLELLNASLEKHPSTEIAFPNGRTYYAAVSAVVADGQLVGRVCILRDITHYKELDSLKSDFVATVSHDLRSPLTLVRGNASMLQMVGDLNEEQKGYVRKILTGVESMTRLVVSLLDLGRIEAGIGLQLEKVPVIDVSERVLNLLQVQAAQKSIQLQREYPVDQNPVIDADQALLQQALFNLVENAIKYTAVGGQVKVKLRRRPEAVLFEIQDNGIGIAPLDQPRLFEKFYRGGQREAHMQRGSGLGLAIVKSIVERHGGRVWVESQLGRGSTFYLELPLVQVRAVKA